MNSELLKHRGATVDEKVESLLSQLTIEEKISLCHAATKFSVGAVERLGIPAFEMSDGPHGVRQEISKDSWQPAGWTNDHATYLPTGTAQAATWNPEMATLAGTVLGAEARERGKDVILGPGFNIVRTPLCGRNFEYYGEDPYQIAKLATAAVRAIQTQDVAACVKHYAANNQELNRSSTDVEMDERTLREIYLPGFEAAVKDGGVLTIMGAYNKFRGQHCCHNAHLVNEILKKEWGFKGSYLTDWNGAHDTEEAVNNGLDIEMGTSKPYDEYYLANPYLEGLKAERFDEETLNDKVRRNLRVMYLIGMFDEKRLPGQRNTEKHQKAALRIAQEAIVLLKNENATLPLCRKQVKKVAVIGENATRKHSTGGESSAVKAFYEVTPLEGLRGQFGDAVEFVHVKGYPENKSGLSPISAEYMSTVDQGSGVKGWVVEYFNNQAHEGDCVARDFETTVQLDCNSMKMPEGISDALFSIRWRGELTPPESGDYEIGIHTDGVSRVFLDDELIAKEENHIGTGTDKKTIHLEAGKKYQLVVEYQKGPNSMFLEFGWNPCWMNEEANVSLFDQAIEAAKESDAVLFFGGLNHLYDVEGRDRLDMKLPGGQDELISAISKVNVKTIVCLVGGAAVEMPWVDYVPAIVQMWYAGMEVGNAIAQILFGDVNPSGKLPFTFPKKLDDCSAHKLGTYEELVSKYDEGVLVGYRYHLTEKVEPLFAFGHGLSYTTFDYSNIRVEKADDCVARVLIDIKNTGDVDGAEVAQLYLKDVESSVPRPALELKGFEKVFLKSGETRTISFDLFKRDLSFWDIPSNDWKVEPGEFEVHIGGSCEDIRLTDRFEYPLRAL